MDGPLKALKQQNHFGVDTHSTSVSSDSIGAIEMLYYYYYYYYYYIIAEPLVNF